MPADISKMHRLEIRELRFRLQQRIGKLEDGPEKSALEAEVLAIQEACPHASAEEGDKGWRCRDCDASRDPEPVEPEEVEEPAPTPAAPPAAADDTSPPGE